MVGGDSCPMDMQVIVPQDVLEACPAARPILVEKYKGMIYAELRNKFLDA